MESKQSPPSENKDPLENIPNLQIGSSPPQGGKNPEYKKEANDYSYREDSYSDIERERERRKSNKLDKQAAQSLGIKNIDHLMELFDEEEWQMFQSMFSINNVLGCGGFGVVLSVKDLKYKKNIALKIVHKKDIKAEMLRHEYEVLKDLRHENIIKIYSLLNFENFLMMSMKLTQESLSDFAA